MLNSEARKDLMCKVVENNPTYGWGKIGDIVILEKEYRNDRNDGMSWYFHFKEGKQECKYTQAIFLSKLKPINKNLGINKYL